MAHVYHGFASAHSEGPADHVFQDISQVGHPDLMSCFAYHVIILMQEYILGIDNRLQMDTNLVDSLPDLLPIFMQETGKIGNISQITYSATENYPENRNSR